MSYLSSYCHITSNKCLVNGKEILSSNSNSITDFSSELYAFLDSKYSKFHKMDQLSKVAFIGSELIIKDIPEMDKFGDNDIAILFSNRRSSASTDLRFKESYQNGGIPSPSLFVYTLPNILIGEISIKNKWYGESLFTISQDFDAAYYSNYCNILLNKNSKAVLCGWVNVDDEKIEAFFFFVTKKDIKQLNLQLDSNKLMELFKAIKFE